MPGGISMKREELLYPSNLLSMSRIVLLPLLYILLFMDQWIAFVITYAILGSTDYFDGKLARRRNEITELGKKLDSWADVIFYLSSAFFLYHFHESYIMNNYTLLMGFFCIFILSFIVSAIRLKKLVVMHTNILRLAATMVYFTVIFSFFINGTYLVTLTLITYYIGFTEEILIFIFYGDVDPDIRYLWWLMKGDRTD